MIGIFASMSGMLLLGIVLLAAGVVFQIVTLPVEFNASNRAMNQMVSLGIIRNEEERHAKKVLNAAAITYVAAAAVAVLELFRLVLIYTGMSSKMTINDCYVKCQSYKYENSCFVVLC